MAISPKDAKLLWGRAGGHCCFPECTANLLPQLDGDIVLGEMAHVIGRQPGSARSDAAVGIDDSYDNLILLCPTHHTLVDRVPDDFPVETLRHWKTTREERVRQLLASSTDVPGDVDALAPLAEGSRGRVTALLTGREQDLKWLREIDGDALLVGQPGSGKTALHEQLAAEGRCLFVRSFDSTRLRSAILRHNPRCIVVDDAHLEPSRLAALWAFRNDVKGSFTIHANCWPSQRNECQAALKVNAQHVRDLELLTRDQIVEVIKAVGLDGPDVALFTILAQAVGRPGLAVVLAKACLADSHEGVWTGEVMAEFMLDARQMGPTSEEQTTLGVLSLADDWGMTLDELAHALQEPLTTVRKRLAHLAAGGTLEDMGGSRVKVQSAALRFLLVKRVFFDSPAIGIERFADRVRPDNLIHGLLGARQRKAPVDIQLIRQVVTGCTKSKAWEHLAHTDRQCAELFLELRPDYVLSGADGLLHFLPDETLRALFNRCAKTTRVEANSHPVHRAVSGWLTEDLNTPGEVVRRKTLLAKTLLDWSRQAAPDQFDGLGDVVAAVLSLGYSSADTVPGSGGQITIRTGTFADHVAAETLALWPIVCQILAFLPKPQWRTIFHVIDQLAAPWRFEQTDVLRSLLRQSQKLFAFDLARHVSSNRAVRAWAANRLARWGADVSTLPDDPVYNSLFIARQWQADWRTEEQRVVKMQEMLAQQIAARPVVEALPEILALESEAAQLGLTDVHQRWTFYATLATRTAQPECWAGALIDARADSMHMWPFLSRLVKEKHADARPLLQMCLSVPHYQTTAALQVLMLEPRDEELFQAVMSNDQSGPVPDAHALARQECSIELRLELLTCPNARIRAAAAVAEMIRAEQQPIPPELLEAWKAAVLDCHDDHTPFWIERIAKSIPGLACSWLRRRVQASDVIGQMNLSHCISPLLPSLTLDDRAELLGLLTEKRTFAEELFEALLAGDMALFDRWYQCCTDDTAKAEAVASGYPSTWEARVEIGLRHGASEQLVLEACCPRQLGGSGSMREYYEKVGLFFERLRTHQHPAVRKAAAQYVESVTALTARFAREEHERAVKGGW